MSHKSIETLQGEDVVFTATDINRSGARCWVMMQSCFGHHFRLLLEKRGKSNGYGHFYAIVQLIGTRKQAKNFEYRLELKSQRKCLTWESTSRSIYEEVSVIIENSACLGFETHIAKLLACQGKLRIHVSISVVYKTGVLWC
jgi:hypothetical protein